MQKIIKILVMLTFVASTLFTLTASTNAGFRWAETKADTENDTPRSLYITNCARCHGADGSSQTTLGKKLEAPDLRESAKEMSSGKIVRIITNGKSDMPSFKRKLTKAQISSLASYIRKL
jgi:mono/diheme cytochrome c family protein